jgi:hypothetical protein
MSSRIWATTWAKTRSRRTCRVRWGRTPRPPSQTWGTFIRTHAVCTIAIDFFSVPTVTFGVLYVFFVLSLRRDVEPPSMGRVVALPRLGALHHRYRRIVA